MFFNFNLYLKFNFSELNKQQTIKNTTNPAVLNSINFLNTDIKNIYQKKN